MFHKERKAGAAQTLKFFVCHSFFWCAKTGRASRFHLYKDQYAMVATDQINFALARTKIPRHDRVAPLHQEFFRQSLAAKPELLS